MSRGQTRLTGIFCPAGLPELFINRTNKRFFSLLFGRQLDHRDIVVGPGAR